MSAETVQPRSGGTAEKTFMGQPRPLANLFGVELWERFSFYGMQGILLIYMYYAATDGGLGIDKTTAAGIVGAYGGGVYLSTILGAWLADRLLGAERMLFYSAILVMAGHIFLAVLPGTLGLATGLVSVALGSGGVKANASTMVGTLYSKEDPRRDSGFSIFYLGINIGAFAGPLLTGLLQSELGFHYGFGLAALGMAFGLAQYAIGRKNLPDEANVVHNPLPASDRGKYIGIIGGIVVLVGVLLLTGVMGPENLDKFVIAAIIIATVAYFVVILRSPQVTATERSRVFAFIPLFIASAAFWSLYQQQFTVVTIYSDTRLDRDIFGWTMPVSWVQSLSAVYIILMAGVFAALWTKWGDRQPSTAVKFGASNVIMGIAFLMFIVTAGGGPNSAPLLWLALILFVFTIAELLISPVGLSVTTKLAPAKFHTQMMALFFLSISLGSALAGTLAGFYDENNEAPYFGVLGGISIAIGLILIAVSPKIKKLMAGVK